MKCNEAFGSAERYIAGQKRFIDLAIEEELGSAVVSSLYKLACEHVEPLVHTLAQNVPPVQEPWLYRALTLNMGDVLPASLLAGLLPARHSEQSGDARGHSLMLPLDGGVMKVVTSTSPRNIFMEFTRLGPVRQEEMALYLQEEAVGPSGTAAIQPDARILAPRAVVEYGHWNTPREGYLISSMQSGVNGAGPIEHEYSHYAHVQTQPQELLAIHAAFMSNTRLALAALRELAR